MIRKIRQFITDNNLIDPEKDRLLLAVSGGPDSVAMADIIHRLGFKFGICHVNFQLRGSDSDGDQEFVQLMAKRYNAEFHLLKADTQQYAQQKAISIEMAAREIRYAEFSRLMNTSGYTLTAVAHHQDDAIETLLLNLTRGAGIRGLTGIRTKNGNIIRPLMCLSRSEIESYLKERKLTYRTDKTNLETDYARNKIRNLVIPILEQINPSARASISESLQYLGMAKTLYANSIDEAIPKVLAHDHAISCINIKKLMAYPEPECLIYEIVSRYGFHKAQARDILRATSGESGRIFRSKTHQITKDRNSLIISTLSADAKKTASISDADIERGLADTYAYTIIIEKMSPADFAPERRADTIYLDYTKLQKLGLPMEINPWQKGDVITVFGGQKKKVSDILIDNKLSINEKQNVEILSAGGKILWIIGIRAGNHCRIDQGTKLILKITAKKK